MYTWQAFVCSAGVLCSERQPQLALCLIRSQPTTLALALGLLAHLRCTNAQPALVSSLAGDLRAHASFLMSDACHVRDTYLPPYSPRATRAVAHGKRKGCRQTLLLGLQLTVLAASWRPAAGEQQAIASKQ